MADVVDVVRRKVTRLKKNNHYKKVSTNSLKLKIRFCACKEKLNTLIKLAIKQFD